MWGSILQEDALNMELNCSLGVGRKSVKDIASDRGAETYDYTLAAEQEKAAREAAQTARNSSAKQELDRDLKQYWEDPNPG